MITRLIIAGATIVALGAPAAQAAQCSFFAVRSQCLFQFTTGNGNKSMIQQDQRGKTHGLQLAIHAQDGDNNNAYTGQKGTNEVALTVQNGNNNTAYTSQSGENKASVTIQNADGAWAATSSGGDNTLTYVIQSN